MRIETVYALDMHPLPRIWRRYAGRCAMLGSGMILPPLYFDCLAKRPEVTVIILECPIFGMRVLSLDFYLKLPSARLGAVAVREYCRAYKE